MHVRNWNFNPVCVLLLLTVCVILVLWNELNQKFQDIFLFSYTAPCEEETNMAVESAMTCKLDCIWCHMKTLIATTN